MRSTCSTISVCRNRRRLKRRARRLRPALPDAVSARARALTLSEVALILRAPQAPHHRGGKAMVEVKVAGIALDDRSKTPIVILQEISGNRVLPIWIGPN